ncbi:MAG: NAD(P)-dependent oxidoreductase [Phycisphaerae bacterium]
MKILIADKFDRGGIEALEGLGARVECQPALAGDALQEALQAVDPRVLIVRGTRVTGEMFEVSDALGLVVRAGAGVNTIDLSAASRRSVLVANCPGKNAVAVAELAFALILALDRRIVEGVNDLRNGVWNKKEYATARGLKGRTLGIIGTGQIGRAVAARARGFEMDVVAWSRSLTPDRAEALGVTPCADPGEVAACCDILSIHCAAVPETRHLISAAVLDRLQPGSFVINTARAEIMDYEALANAMVKKNLRVGLDVFAVEPASGRGDFTDGIVKAGGLVYGTHHIGASTDQAQEAIAQETVLIVTEYLRTGRVRNCVNLCARTPARYVVIVRHRNRAGVLAHTLHEISHAGVNVEEMENVICDGAESACAQIKLDGPLADDVLSRIKSGNEHIFAVTHGPLHE